MKNYKNYMVLTVLSLVISSVDAQTINWGSLKEEDRQIADVNFGGDYGITYGLGYGYHLKTGLFDIVPNIEYSFPSGKIIFDDYKIKVGGLFDWVEINNFHFSTRIHGVFRRFENDFTRLLNFGSDVSGIIGYYKPKWFVAAEAGFDKAIVTHFKHSELYESIYPDIVNGWYEPATGGNFYYGLQAGYSFKRHDIYLDAGKVISQDFATTPLLPFYFELGYNIKFD